MISHFKMLKINFLEKEKQENELMLKKYFPVNFVSKYFGLIIKMVSPLTSPSIHDDKITYIYEPNKFSYNLKTTKQQPNFTNRVIVNYTYLNISHDFI